MSLLQRLLVVGAVLPGLSVPAMAQTVSESSDSFLLGTIWLGAETEEGQGGTATKVTGEDARKQNRLTLEDALATQPGVSSISSGGGARNEREVFVRGFDRWHVPLSIDGIRVYLPADNRLDFGRFLTTDLASIEVQKGYVSVINGSGGVGGTINLVTKRPTKAFEGSASLGLDFGNRGDLSGKNGSLTLGTKQETWYAQFSYTRRESDGFYLSRDFDPVPQEDGGLRDFSDTSDDRVNLKFGFTPNATDEYVLSYTKQTGDKRAPYDTVRPIRLPGGGTTPGIGGTQRDWTWPQWDFSSLAFYSHTELQTGYLKTKVFYNAFDNVLKMWDDNSHSTQTQPSGPPSNTSTYDDYSVGASIEYGFDIAQHELKFAAHFRRDVHESTDLATPSINIIPDDTEYTREETYSFAVEDTWRLREDLRLVGGISYERARVIEADRTAIDPGYDPLSLDAVNWQFAAIWSPEAGGEYHASISSRTAFPNRHLRYSTRFGTFEPNPDLGEERATNFEIGYKGEIGGVSLGGAVFYSEVDDLIQAVWQRTIPDPRRPGRFVDVMQNQNVGDGKFKGVEVAASWEVNDRLTVSGNYTYIDASLKDPSITGLRVTDIPNHKAYLRLDWQATDTLRVSPSLEVYGSRWSDPANGQDRAVNPVYTYEKMSGFGLANLDLSWQARENVSVDFGVRNLFDRDYSVTHGFPEAGRSFYLTSQITF